MHAKDRCLLTTTGEHVLFVVMLSICLSWPFFAPARLFYSTAASFRLILLRRRRCQADQWETSLNLFTLVMGLCVGASAVAPTQDCQFAISCPSSVLVRQGRRWSLHQASSRDASDLHTSTRLRNHAMTRSAGPTTNNERP